MKIAFLFFLSRWKGNERSGGNLRWFPLDPLSTFDGDAVPLDSPCSVGYLLRFSSGGGTEGTARAKSERRIKARGFTRGRKLAGYRNLGRKRKRLQAAHRRARVDICRQSFRFPSGFWFGGGVEGAGRDFGIKISWGMSLSGFMFFIK